MIFCLTNAGREYMARVNAGEIGMHLTRAVTGAGISSYPEILTSVVDEQQQIQLDAVHSDGEYTIIECVLTNLELGREYILKQLGLYASDGIEEGLIIIGQDTNGDRIPVLSDKEVEYQYSIGMRISNAADVTFDFSVNDFVRKKYFYEHCAEFEDYKDEVDNRFKALPRVRIGPEGLLDRKDTILFETMEGTDLVTRIQERDHEDVLQIFEFASIFKTAEQRERLQSREAVSILFGKIERWFEDMRTGCFKEADDPFTLMTESTYKIPAKRLRGNLYGLITKVRGLIVFEIDRYVQGLENPRVERTMYGVTTSARADVEPSPNPYAGVLNCIIFLDGSSTGAAREPEKLYGTIKTKK